MEGLAGPPDTDRQLVFAVVGGTGEFEILGAVEDLRTTVVTGG